MSNFNNLDIQTNIGIGHVRYPTKGSLSLDYAQPLYIKGKFHTIALVHNGQIDPEYVNNTLNINDTNQSDSIYLLKYLSYLLDKYVILNDENIIEIVKDVQKIKWFI